ncbi:MAG: T9SS type A sorting domain-containing protein [Saprospirales bacterium]|nr:T9SS type A sorting domain-containing protein [Saprospirales bacterium]
MKKMFYLLILFLLGAQLSAQTVVNITDNDIQAGQTVNWTKDKVYLCDGVVFVEDGATLNIEAGTVVKFTPRADVGNPSALVVARGAKIFANGTAAEPIIFTAEADNVNDPLDLGPKDNALWGGIVLLGNGITQKNGVSPVQVEGIPTTEPRGQYGGNDNADNSGVLRYVSIRHGGRQIASGNELNGLTLGAVGSGTTLEYVEVYANSDDGIEFFGGAPNLKYAVVAFAEDDSHDWDEVYSGKGQFWFSIQRDDVADSGGEFDGSTPDDLTPYSNPTVYNWTHIGSGVGAAASNPVGWNLRAGTAGTLANCIVTDMKNKGLEVQDKAAGVNDAYAKLASGELKLQSNLFFQIGSFTALDASPTGIIRVSGTAEDPTAAALVAHLTTNKNAVANPEIQSINRGQSNLLDPRPAGNTAVTADLAALPANDPFFTPVSYKGAFSPFAAGLWIQGWSTLARNNHLKDLTSGGQLVFINDASIKACDNVTWTKDKTYVVDGLTFVDSCAALTIEAGTVVKFTPRADVGNPSALVVAKGAKIFANGTAAEPIIFTAEADNVNDPLDLGPKDNALWGGIVFLGNGITQKNGVSPVQVEGIPTTEPRARYGGNNNADNSGVLRYVSIRHGGRQIASGNELNGLTLGAVGSGTTLEYVEVYANSDDGIEFFGGAPNLKYAVVAFAEDDSYDWDEVYSGKGQFWFSIQRDDVADAGGELDGTTPDDGTPYSNPTVYNWTHIGSGPGAAASNPVGWNLRAGTAGTLANCIVTDMKNKGLEVQDKAAGVNDAYAKLASGELNILNNIFYRIGSFNTLDASGIIRVSGTAEDPTAAALVSHLTTNQTTLFSPYLRSISRSQNDQLDPRPCTIGAAYTTALAIAPADPFFTMVNYKGAFSSEWNDLWIRGWSALDRNDHLANAPVENCPTTGAGEADLQQVFSIYPNPAKGLFIVESKFGEPVSFEIFDLSGRTVARRVVLQTGTQQVYINELSTGMYLIQFRTEAGQTATKKLLVE